MRKLIIRISVITWHSFKMTEEGECVSSEDSETESILLEEESDEEKDADKVALSKLQQLGHSTKIVSLLVLLLILCMQVVPIN